MVHLNPDDPDLLALMVTIGFTADLIQREAPTTEWAALTRALEAEHTPTQLANMLTGAAALITRGQDGTSAVPAYPKTPTPQQPAAAGIL